ncbi:MAG: HD domain-containing protein [Deltaproteobacteria bacterium]|nr:HD domain-containing protein [Deltaproteobacteria bacterium]
MRVTDIIKKLSTAYALEKIPPHTANDIQTPDEDVVSKKTEESQIPSNNEVVSIVSDVNKDTKSIKEDNAIRDDIVFDDITSEESNDILIPSDNKTNLIFDKDSKLLKEDNASHDDIDIVFDDIIYKELKDVQIPSNKTDNISFSNAYLVREENSQKKNGYETLNAVKTSFLTTEFPFKLADISIMYEGENYFIMWRELNNFMIQLTEGKKPDPSVVIKTANVIVNLLVDDNNELIRALFVEKKSEDITSQLINVAIITAKIGTRLGYRDSQLKDLVTCALLHDVGMLKVPEKVRRKRDKLTEEEFEEIKKHPQYSYDMLNELTGLPSIVAEVVYQEQEREDGSGYPLGLRGDSIHEYAKIIGLSAIYASMIQPRPQRGRKFPFDVIKEIIGKCKGQFPECIIKAIIDELSVFPIGIYVTLNTGEVGRVIKTNKLAPMRPVIEVVRDFHGKKLKEPKRYDLTKERVLQVKDTLYEVI